MAKYLMYFLVDLVPILVYWGLLLVLLLFVTCGPEEIRQAIFEAYLAKLPKLPKLFKTKKREENENAHINRSFAATPNEETSLTTSPNATSPNPSIPVERLSTRTDEGRTQSICTVEVKDGEKILVYPPWFTRCLFFLIFPVLATAGALYWDALIIKVDRGSCLPDTDYVCFEQENFPFGKDPINCSDSSEVSDASRKFVCYQFAFNLGVASIQALSFVGTYVLIVTTAAELLMLANAYMKTLSCCSGLRARATIIVCQSITVLIALGTLISVFSYYPTRQYFFHDIAKVLEFVGTIATVCCAAMVPWYLVEQKDDSIRTTSPHQSKNGYQNIN